MSNQPSDRELAGKLYKGTTLLRPLELILINYLAPRIPKSIQTYHLTIFSLVISGLMLTAAWLSRSNLSWFWLVVVGILLRYLTDALDGEVGRNRGTGLVKWGFYTDHFLDYVAMSAIFVSHAIAWPEDIFVFILLMVIFGSFFIHESLSCICLGKYNIRGYGQIGATEMEFLLILVDSAILIFKPERVGIIFLIMCPYFLYTLARAVYQKQRFLWKLDMQAKGRSTHPVLRT